MLVINYDEYGSWVGAAKRLIVGPVIWFSSIGIWCIRNSSLAKGSPSKTGVEKGFGPVPEVLYDDGTSPPKPTSGMKQDGGV